MDLSVKVKGSLLGALILIVSQFSRTLFWFKSAYLKFLFDNLGFYDIRREKQ
jgi:hypothetical protein